MIVKGELSALRPLTNAGAFAHKRYAPQHQRIADAG